MSDTFARFLVRHVPALRRKHPGIELDLVVGDRMVDITRGEADLAVRFSPAGRGMPGVPAGDENVLVQKLGIMKIGVFASRSYLERAGRPKSALSVAGHEP